MKNLFLTKTRWLVTIILLTALGIGNVWGADVKFTFSSYGWSNGTAHTSVTSSPITITANGGGNNGKYYTSDKSWRMYSGGSLTITAETGYQVTAVSSSPTQTFTVSNGSASISFSGTVKFTSITVTYEPVCSGTQLETPVVTATPSDGQVILSWQDVSNASGYQLKWNGGDWVAATSPVTKTGLTNGTAYTYQVKAIGNGSTYCDGDASEEASVTPNVYYTVTWKNNGSTYTTTSVVGGQKPEFPSNPSSCDGTSTTFYGWSTSEWSGKIDNISAKTIYTSAASMPTVSGAITYYAVFCKGGGGSEVLNEEFDNNQTTDASTVFSSSTFSNFSGATSKAYKSKYGGVKFGTSSAVGYITSKSLDLSKAFTVSIDACKYGSDAGNIEVTVGSTTKTISNSSLDAQGSFKTFVLEFDAATSTSTVKIGTSSKRAYIDNVVITTAGTASQYLTTCQACVAPTSVTITGTNKYLGGQKISLTAAPEGGTGEPSYQWQKKISGVWTNLANDGSISGVTSNNLQISSCSYVNSGGYRCIVSTGDGCETKSHADDTNGYGVHVFSLTGGYSGGDWSAHDITWTSGTTGTATIHLNASSTYMFKVFSNNDYYYGNGENNYIIQPVSWDCGINNHDMRLFTGPEGDYTFTVNIEHGLDGSPYVNVQVGYPAVSHPSTGYIYISKWWDCYVHYWEGTDNALMPWGSDPKIDADRYTTICGNNYWYFPVIATYNKFIAKDKAGNPENTTGDQVTTNHGGMYITHNGSNWVWGNFATYTIAYAGGDGSTGGPMASHTGLCPGSSQQLTANAFSKSGYNFSGWTANVDVKIGGSTVPAGTLITGTPIIENVQSNITLTAQWRDLAQYHVTFSADNGTVAGGASQTVTEGGTLTFPNVTSTTCGTFIGWVEAAYDNTAAPSGATFHAAGSQIDVVAELEGKTYYAVYRVATGMATTLTDNLVPSDFKATGTSYEATNNLVKTSSATYEAVTAKGNNAIQINKISDGRGIVSKISGGIFKGITLTTNANHSASRKVYVYGSSSYTAAYADPAAFNTNSEVRGTLLATLAGDTKTYSTSTDDYEYIAIFADGAAYLDQISLTWYGAPMKYQTSPACSPVINMTSSFSSFTYVYGSGPSASQSFTVSGANLGANLVVTAPANYEVCKTFGGDYTTSVSYTPSDGTVTDQTVYIRLKAGLNVGAYNYAAASGVSAASTGATTRTAALTGSVTKAAGAIAFTDFNAGDHYEAEWTGSAILVPYNYILTGDGTLTTTKVDGRGGTVDTENKKWSLTNEGTYQLRLTLGNGTNYTGAGPVTADFVIYKADRFYDNLHGNDVIVKRNDTGEDHYTIPSLTDESRQTSGSCSETHYHFMGWVPESALSTLSNDAAYDAVMITGGGTQAASGTNYYAVWAEE